MSLPDTSSSSRPHLAYCKLTDFENGQNLAGKRLMASRGDRKVAESGQKEGNSGDESRMRVG